MNIPAPYQTPPDAAIVALAARYERASGGMMALLNRLGGQVEGQLALLPAPIQARVHRLTLAALERAYGVARQGGRLGRLGAARHRLVAGAAGALGGLGGLPTALAELPVTVTLILNTVQEVAQEHGFDPAEAAVRREVLRVFASGAPLAGDDGVNTAFLGARLTLTGPALQRMIALVVPRIAASLGPKLVAQSVPVLGAAAGAGINLSFAAYYRELAHIRFGLLRLAMEHDPELVARAFARASRPVPLTRA